MSKYLVQEVKDFPRDGYVMSFNLVEVDDEGNVKLDDLFGKLFE